MTRRFSSQLSPIKLSDDLRQALQQIADEREIPLALAVREAIRLYVKFHGKNSSVETL
ncbi:MAG: hypothetical protein RMI89_03700 [Gloeomargarita sp. SKYBB_i_bin120]|nr:hypothetical protein [Gloeomargarita sp. SKYG98]MCS7292063.1 hypothetical protein [Gloeomargarita sp. SKYB120]MDW8177623.1 hypothetical protein [Gloeomargarita sp. SKYBB_i_bin120]